MKQLTISVPESPPTLPEGFSLSDKPYQILLKEELDTDRKYDLQTALLYFRTIAGDNYKIACIAIDEAGTGIYCLMNDSIDAFTKGSDWSEQWYFTDGDYEFDLDNYKAYLAEGENGDVSSAWSITGEGDLE